MKWQMLLILASVLSICTVNSTPAFAESPTVTHVVTEDETAWFIASVYYGRGQDFPKLLVSNQLQRPEDVKEGMTLKIERPKFSKHSRGFAERYATLWNARQKALGLVGNALPTSKVVLPTEQILNRDSTPTLPFTEVRETRQAHIEN